MSSNRRTKGKLKKKKNGPSSVEDLIDKALDLAQQGNVDLAEKYFLKALEMEPTNVQALDNYAYLLLDLDDFDKAKQLLERSIQLAPGGDYTKYLQLGQIYQGKQSVDCYSTAVKVMLNVRQQCIDKVKMSNDEEAKEALEQVNHEIAGAFCSIAEIYMTDACFEETAEKECGNALEQAVQYDPNNFEVYQTLASYRISQQNNDDALVQLKKSYSLWKDLPAQQLPGLVSYEFRHNTAKLFMELGDHSTAVDIWEQLIDEEEKIAEVHYHLALAYRPLSTTNAKESAAIARQLLVESKCDDPQLYKQIDELIAQLEKENIEILPEDDNNNNNNIDDETMEIEK